MRLKQHWGSVFVAAMLGGLVGVTAVAAVGAQFLPLLVIREGSQRSLQIPLANGYIDYVTLLNARDGGIYGVPLVWEECETVYDVSRGVECYERLKAKGPTGAAVVMLFGTPLVSALLEWATHDQIPLLSTAFGRSDAAEGRVFPYVFPAPSTYWSQTTAKLRFIGHRVGGREQLKGRKIAHVYLDTDLAGTPSPCSTHRRPTTALRCSTAVPLPGLDQKATWLRVKVAQPDWVILRTRGVMTRTALQETAHVGVSLDKIVGSHLTCAEQELEPAGAAAIGFICVTWHGTGTHFPLIQELLQYVYARGKGAGPERDVGTGPWMWGMLRGLFIAEALRTAMRHFGNQPLTGAQVQWGLDHLVRCAPAFSRA